MKISTGTDIVRLDRVRTLVHNGQLDRMLLPHEIRRSDTEHIAGLIALKEAAIKALGLSADDWLRIVIRHGSAKPTIDIADYPDTIASMDSSVSHDGDYATAVVVVLYRE